MALLAKVSIEALVNSELPTGHFFQPLSSCQQYCFQPLAKRLSELTEYFLPHFVGSHSTKMQPYIFNLVCGTLGSHVPCTIKFHKLNQATILPL